MCSAAQAGDGVGVGAVDEGVADRQVEGEGGSILQSGQSAGLERGEGEAEAGDGDGEGVEVDAVYGVQSGLDAGLVSSAGAAPCQRSSRRSKVPRRKWPEPQVGSIMRKPSRGRSAKAGSRVRSRMNSSTNPGGCSSA
jgi:hypothetical protein